MKENEFSSTIHKVIIWKCKRPQFSNYHDPVKLRNNYFVESNVSFFNQIGRRKANLMTRVMALWKELPLENHLPQLPVLKEMLMKKLTTQSNLAISMARLINTKNSFTGSMICGQLQAHTTTIGIPAWTSKTEIIRASPIKTLVGHLRHRKYFKAHQPQNFSRIRNFKSIPFQKFPTTIIQM